MANDQTACQFLRQILDAEKLTDLFDALNRASLWLDASQADKNQTPTASQHFNGEVPLE
jgi:hypothetical protein